MKKLKVIALSALAFVTIASTIFASCQKQQELVNTHTNSEETITNFKIASIKFLDKHKNAYQVKTRRDLGWADWITIGCADAGGAYEGATIAAPLLPPWGSVAGGAIFGAAASYGAYIGLGGTPMGMATHNGTNNTSMNSNNQYDLIGKNHNLLLSQLGTSTVNNDLSEMYSALLPSTNNITDNNLNIAQFKEFISVQNFSNAYSLNHHYTGSFNDLSSLTGYFNRINQGASSVILANYFNQISEISHLQNAINYSIDIENYITNSNMVESDKVLLLSAMSTFRNSINFWSDKTIN